MSQVTLLLLVTSVFLLARGETRIFSTPNLSPAIKESSEGFSFFLYLWEYSLRVDTVVSTRTNIVNLEPKTLLLPGDLSMANLVPQDAAHPLLMNDLIHKKLRKDFILDHLMLNTFPKNDPAINTKKGLSETTLSGKTVKIQRKASGDLFVEGVRVKKTVTLPDGSQIFVIEHPLFNQTEIVRQAFNTLHKILKGEPLGPPLDIPFFSPQRAFAPAPPPINDITSFRTNAQPPATPRFIASPPADPQQFASPPAPPHNHN